MLGHLSPPPHLLTELGARAHAQQHTIRGQPGSRTADSDAMAPYRADCMGGARRGCNGPMHVCSQASMACMVDNGRHGARVADTATMGTMGTANTHGRHRHGGRAWATHTSHRGFLRGAWLPKRRRDKTRSQLLRASRAFTAPQVISVARLGPSLGTRCPWSRLSQGPQPRAGRARGAGRAGIPSISSSPLLASSDRPTFRFETRRLGGRWGLADASQYHPPTGRGGCIGWFFVPYRPRSVRLRTKPGGGYEAAVLRCDAMQLVSTEARD